MLKSIVISLAKKYALKAVQSAVEANKDTVVAWCARIGVWLEKIGRVVAFLEGLRQRLSDGVLTVDESDEAVEEAKLLAAEVTAK